MGDIRSTSSFVLLVMVLAASMACTAESVSRSGGSGIDGGDGGGGTAYDAAAPPEDAAPQDTTPAVAPPFVPTAEQRACMDSYASRDLEAILAACPQFRTRILWIGGNDTRAAYEGWTAAQRQELGEAFRAFLAGRFDVPANCPDPVRHMMSNGSGGVSDGFVPAAAAFSIFAAHVAHALWVEVTRAVPWSLLERPASELDELFVSSAYHAPIRPSATQLPAGIQARRDFMPTFEYEVAQGRLCRPHDAYTFMRGETSTSGRDLVASGPRQTLARLSLWATDNMIHGATSDDPGAMRAERMLEGYPFFVPERLSVSSVGSPIIARGGCHYASTLFQDLARSVNIPLLNVAMPDHFDSGYFGSRTHRALAVGWAGNDARFLPHMDDVYALGLRPFLAVRPVSAFTDAAALRFFDATWMTRDALVAVGFRFAPGLPFVVPGVGPGFGSSPEFETRVDYGRLLGTWPFVEGRSAEWRAYTALQEEALCSSDLVTSYCVTVEASGGEAEFTRAVASTYPQARTPAGAERLWRRLRACVGDIGGCAAARAALASYPPRRPSDTVWRRSAGADAGATTPVDAGADGAVTGADASAPLDATVGTDASSTVPPTGPALPLGAGRWKHAAVGLPDGRSLVIGGMSNGSATASIVVIGVSGVVSPFPSDLSVPRARHSAIRLGDGRVLVVGGVGADLRTALATTEIVDVTSGTVSAGPSMSVGRVAHAAVPLSDGSVLIAGGISTLSPPTCLVSAERFVPRTGVAVDRFVSAENPMPDGFDSMAATVDPSGAAWLFGGACGSGVGIVRYTVGSGFARSPSSLVRPRVDGTATMLQDGRILLAGGLDTRANAMNIVSELFAPATGSVIPGPSLVAPRYGHRAIALADGRVFLSGGYYLEPALRSRDVVEFFDPSSSSFGFRAVAPLVSPRADHAFVLSGSRLLHIGGVATTASGTSELATFEFTTP